eukprot:15433923-Alexandrium_andersonii.AAC.1
MAVSEASFHEPHSLSPPSAFTHVGAGPFEPMHAHARMESIVWPLRMTSQSRSGSKIMHSEGPFHAAC